MRHTVVSFIITGAVALGAVSCAGNTDSITSNKDASAVNSDAGTEHEPAPIAAGNEYSFKAAEEQAAPEFNSAAAEFSAELFKNICSSAIAGEKNALASPQSVMLALGLAANGAGGDTLSQFEQVLGKGMKLEDINKGLAGQISKAKASNDVKYDIANSIWVREGGQITLKKSYAELCKERFDADSYLAPFNNDTVTEINNWVKDHTGGMIDKIKDRFGPNEVAVLLNAIAFDAKWEAPYEEFAVRVGRFTAADGKEQACKMMNSTEHTFISDSNTKGFVKNYAGGQYAFMAMLPDESVTLKDMGLEKAFDPAADFSNMAETASGELFISDIIHKTHIDVDTEGTKAGAVTEILMTEGAMMVEDEILEVTLDRPFVFAIVDTETGLPIFMGAVNTIDS